MSSVAIVGCGTAGLVSIKTCLENNLNPTCFEQSDNLGGVWYYSETLRHNQGAASYNSLVANTPGNFMAFSDFPFAAGSPIFPTHDICLKYYNEYADHFNLRSRIRFSTEVQFITFENEKQKWRVQIKEVAGGFESDLYFDFVMVCCGVFRKPVIPQWKGADSFEGIIMHANQFRRPEVFADQNVIVVGGGSSAGEIACDVARASSKNVYLSSREGFWVVPRYWSPGKISYVSKVSTRFGSYLRNLLPDWVFDHVAAKLVNSEINHKGFGLNPKSRLSGSGRLMTSDDLVPMVGCGKLQLLTDGIDFLGGKHVHLTNGQVIKDVGSIICATGYQCDFSFVGEGVFGGPTFTETKLYENVWPIIEDGKHSLAVVGIITSDGAIPPAQELQARWAVAVFQKKKKLPAFDDMMNSWKKERSKKDNLSDSSIAKRPYIEYMDYVASEVGCYPSLFRVFFKFWSLRLIWKLVFGGCMPFQYRLVGPHCWDGAYDRYLNHHRAVDFQQY